MRLCQGEVPGFAVLDVKHQLWQSPGEGTQESGKGTHVPKHCS